MGRLGSCLSRFASSCLLHCLDQPPVPTPSCIPVSAVASPPNRSVSDIPREQARVQVVALTEQERSDLTTLKEFLLKKSNEESSKEKVLQFFRGCDQSLREIFCEAKFAVNCSSRVISVLRASYSSTGSENVTTVPSPLASPDDFAVHGGVLTSPVVDQSVDALDRLPYRLGSSSGKHTFLL